MSWLSRLAFGSPVRAYCLIGDGGHALVRALMVDPRIELVRSARHATVLIVAGDLPEPLHAPARRVHDQLPHPRGVVWCSDRGGPSPFDGRAGSVHVRGPDGVTPAALALQQGLLCDPDRSSPPFGPLRHPVEFRGVGPHGQGGEGMIGGKPYGRAMATTGEDLRDGLRLDRMELTIGPFATFLPPGVRCTVALQGDVVERVLEVSSLLERSDEPEPFQTARRAPVPVASLELARARHHLHAVADVLSLSELHGISLRLRRLAGHLCVAEGARWSGRIRAFETRLRRTGAMALATRGVLAIDRDALPSTGPLARAAGLQLDARSEDPAYVGLAFSPITQGATDARARIAQRLAEAAQAMTLAAGAGDRMRAPGPPLEGPRGVTSVLSEHGFGELLGEHLPGCSWEDFVIGVASLDLSPTTFTPATGRAATGRAFGGREPTQKTGSACAT